MSNSDVSRLLRNVFSTDGAAPLIVLRNAEQLPDAFEGQDLDVSVVPGVGLEQALGYIVNRARDLGWDAVCVSRREHMVGFSLVSSSSATALHFDLFKGITFLSIPLLSPDALSAEAHTVDGIRQLSDRARAAATAIHHMAWSGLLRKQKYVDEVVAVLAEPGDAEWFASKVTEAFGRRAARQITDPGRARALLKPNPVRRLRFSLAVIGHGLRTRPAATLGGIVRYALGQIDSFVHPAGLVGRPGDRFPGFGHVVLDLQLACAISPHAFSVPSVRSSAGAVETVNGARYEASLRKMWRFAAPLRWVFPTLFLWLNAKRGRVAVLENLPKTLALGRRLGHSPRWVAVDSSAGRR